MRQNLGFESAGTTPNGRYVFTGTEAALVQDGPPAMLTNGSPSRLLRYDLKRGTLDRQFRLLDRPDQWEPPVPPTSVRRQRARRAASPQDRRAPAPMERSFSVGAPGTGNKIRLYDVSLRLRRQRQRLRQPERALLAGLRPAKKTLAVDLDELGIPLDNVEGMAFGPKLSLRPPLADPRERQQLCAGAIHPVPAVFRV